MIVQSNRNRESNNCQTRTSSFLRGFYPILNEYKKAYGYVYFPLCFFILSLQSCNYYLPFKTSQLGYQKESNYVLNGVKIIKFNPKTLEDIIQKNKTKNIFIIFLRDNSCPSVAKRNREIVNKYYLNEKVCLIPVVHDYFMNFKSLCKIDTSKIDKLYYTDVKYFGKTTNSIKDFNLKVIGYFYKNINSDCNTNYIFNYKNSLDTSVKKIILYNFGSNDMDSLINNSTKFEYTFTE